MRSFATSRAFPDTTPGLLVPDMAAAKARFDTCPHIQAGLTACDDPQPIGMPAVGRHHATRRSPRPGEWTATSP